MMEENTPMPVGEGGPLIGFADHQAKISGYRKLSDEEIAQINAIKALGGQVDHMIRQIEDGAKYRAHRDPGEARRWAAIAKTHLQQGFMALTRAVALPEGF